MKKKGFSLIELLAVIVVLAIIALIATPIILGVIESSRRKAFEDTGYGVIDAVRHFYVDKLSREGVVGEQTFTFPNSGLSLAGTEPAGGSAHLSAEGKIAIAIHNNQFCVIKEENEDVVTSKRYEEGNCELPDVSGGSTPSGGGTSGNTVTVNDSFTGVVYTTRGIASSPSERKSGKIRLNEAYNDEVPAYTTPQAAMDAATQALFDEVAADGFELTTDGIMRQFLKNTITNGIVTKIEIGFIIDKNLATEYNLKQGTYYLDPHNFEANYTLLNSLFTGEHNELSESGGYCGVPSLDIYISEYGDTLVSVDDGGQGYLGRANSYHSCSYGNPYNGYGYVSSEDRDKYEGTCY